MTYTILEAAKALKCGERKAWELLAEGRLVRAPQFGKKTLVTAESVDALLSPAPVAPKKPKGAKAAVALTWADIRPRV